MHLQNFKLIASGKVKERKGRAPKILPTSNDGSFKYITTEVKEANGCLVFYFLFLK